MHWFLGIGSLVAAAVMARAGKKVCVLEQHDQAGGCKIIKDFHLALYCKALHHTAPHCTTSPLSSYVVLFCTGLIS